MLPALFVLALSPRLQAASLAVPTTPDEAWSLLRTAGCVVTDVRSRGIVARVARDGVAGDGTLAAMAGPPPGSLPDRYPYVSLSIEIGLPAEADPAATERWVRTALPRTGATFTPHLGRTVTAYRFLRLADGETPDTLRAQLDGLWADARAFAAHFGGTPGVSATPDPRGLRLDPATRLRRVDVVSLLRAFDAWGWHSPERADVAFGGWWIALRVGGRTLWARPVDPGLDPSTTRFELVRVAAQPGQRLGEIGALTPADRARDGLYTGGRFHAVEAKTTVDLGDGLPLSELRRRVEAFARN